MLYSAKVNQRVRQEPEKFLQKVWCKKLRKRKKVCTLQPLSRGEL